MADQRRLKDEARRFLRYCLAASVLILCGFFAALPASAADGTALWQALRSGTHVAIMRHALAPGTGDPLNFALRDCGTQRNLSAEGRDQAARIGVYPTSGEIVVIQPLPDGEIAVAGSIKPNS